jgi:hypothetical protein
MNWNKDKSIILSQICTGVFALLLLALDVGAYWLCRGFCTLAVQLNTDTDIYLLMATLYSCSVFAWVILYSLMRLLGNMRRGVVFENQNTGYMRRTSWCCIAVCGICLVSGLYYVPFVLVAASAGFMGLIVRIVKNSFQQAIAMKDELDLTI